MIMLKIDFVKEMSQGAWCVYVQRVKFGSNERTPYKITVEALKPVPPGTSIKPSYAFDEMDSSYSVFKEFVQALRVGLVSAGLLDDKAEGSKELVAAIREHRDDLQRLIFESNIERVGTNGPIGDNVRVGNGASRT